MILLQREAYTVEEVIDILRSLMHQIPYHEVYYKLKQYRVKRFRPQTVEVLRCCIALHQAGFPITVGLVCEILNKKYNDIAPILHTLGDKHVLLLKRKPYEAGFYYANPLYRRSVLEWTLHPAFLKHFEKQKERDSNAIV